jgi:hypothetical protein
MRCSEEGSGARRIGAKSIFGGELRDAEVEDLGSALKRDEDVVRFYVPVHDTLLVGGAERRQHFLDQPSERTDRQAAPLRDHAAERPAIEVLHDDVGPPIAEPREIEDVHDALVPDQIDRARLREEAIDQIWPLRALVRKHLDRDTASNRRIDTFVYASHTARTDEVYDTVWADHGPEDGIRRRSHQGCAVLRAELALVEGEAALGAHVHERSTYHCVCR